MTQPATSDPAPDPAPGLMARTMSTPIGALEIVASAAGVRAVLWPGEDGSRVRRALVGAPQSQPDASAARAHLDQAESELSEYFAGTRRDFTVALDPAGTPFQRSAWDVLRTIPFARTMSYGEQAAALGDPAKARAVGAANGRNPISIIVPCHRVVAASGNLTGFAGGLDTKAWLLDHERAVAQG